MNLYHLRYFQTLAKHEHYTKASKELNITQPSLSYAISTLEDKLGVVLFEKDGRNIILTKYGDYFLEVVNSSLNILDLGIKNMEMLSTGSGTINLGFLDTLGIHTIPDLSNKFEAHQREKGQKINFHFDTGITSELIEGLLDNKHDIIICSKSEEHEGIIDFVPIAEQSLVLAVPENHPLAKSDTVDLNEISEYGFIGYTEDTGLYHVVEDMFKKVDNKPNCKLRIKIDQVLCGMIGAGYGIGIVPELEVLEDLPIKKLKIINPDFRRLFYIAYVKDRYMLPAVEEFIEFTKIYGRENEFIAY